MPTFRTAWISDIHLGTRGSCARELLDFLKEHEFETLYLVGDFIDVWAMRRGIYWPQAHNDVIQKILRKARKGTEVIYITGNHDEFLARFHGQYGGISIRANAVHVTADGRRILVIHGHELDTVVQNMGWLAHLGDVGYSLLMRCNWLVNSVRRFLGLQPWSLSAFVKAEVKNVVSFISQFEDAVARYARDFDVDAVLCGHIHTAAVRQIGAVTYYNTGDWVESCTGIVEHFDGRLELLKFPASGRTLKRPLEEPDSAEDVPAESVDLRRPADGFDLQESS